jgi:hypothetical protein
MSDALQKVVHFKKGDRITHKTLGLATVEADQKVPFSTNIPEGYEMLTINVDVLPSTNHTKIQLVFADACKLV